MLNIIVSGILKSFLKVGKEAVRDDRRRRDNRSKVRKRGIEGQYPKDFSDASESSDTDVVFVKMVSKVWFFFLKSVHIFIQILPLVFFFYKTLTSVFFCYSSIL